MSVTFNYFWNILFESFLHFFNHLQKCFFFLRILIFLYHSCKVFFKILCSVMYDWNVCLFSDFYGEARKTIARL